MRLLGVFTLSLVMPIRPSPTHSSRIDAPPSLIVTIIWSNNTALALVLIRLHATPVLKLMDTHQGPLTLHLLRHRHHRRSSRFCSPCQSIHSRPIQAASILL
ncbi:hypothetical protein BDQ12DRAFT_682823 [Crucibulum laeve]|uniref:Uncharacterized protein n=1 Tax=Crucibulum laeve TaxID=68775 RepID=A0A5C3M2F7_9AGAR|nr:hypothetical protein BDQ12DRAFT_682823 [Crucibulum laeve]